MPCYEGRFQNVDTVTGQDSAKKPVTLNDVTMTDSSAHDPKQ